MTQDRRAFLKSTGLLSVGSAIGFGLAAAARGADATSESTSQPDAPKRQSTLPPALPPGSVPGRRMLINGVNYHIGEQGTGDKVVLMLHGMPDTAGLWRYQIPALIAAGYRVIAPDLLGYGLTDKPANTTRYAADKLIGDVVTLIDSLGVKQMDIVGHDWGGFISWELVLAMPERFRRHVVIATGHPDAMLGQQTPASVKQSWYMYLNTQQASTALYAADDGAFLKRVIMPTHPQLSEVWSRLQDPDAMNGMLNWDRANTMAALYLAASTGELHKRPCAVPTLGMWGSNDQYLWQSQMTASAGLMTAAWRYARIEGASHWAMLDRPQPVNEALLGWLTAV